MRAFFMAMAFVCSLAFVTPAPATANEADIKGIISSQIDAFKVDDFATAFTFASPTIQNLFGTPEHFGRMVASGYPMVWRPAEVSYLDLRMESDGVFQDVRIVDADGTVHLLEYRMQQLEAGWRINGVRLLKAPGVAA